MQKRQHRGPINAPLECFPARTQFATPAVCRCDSQGHEDQEGKPARPDVDFGHFVCREGDRAFVNKVQGELKYDITNGIEVTFIS